MSKQVQDTSGCNDIAAYQPDRFTVVPSDSNLQSTGTVGGPEADHRFVTREGGSDVGYQDALGFGGRELL